MSCICRPRLLSYRYEVVVWSSAAGGDECLHVSCCACVVCVHGLVLRAGLSNLKAHGLGASDFELQDLRMCTHCAL